MCWSRLVSKSVLMLDFIKACQLIDQTHRSFLFNVCQLQWQPLASRGPGVVAASAAHHRELRWSGLGRVWRPRGGAGGCKCGRWRDRVVVVVVATALARGVAQLVVVARRTDMTVRSQRVPTSVASSLHWLSVGMRGVRVRLHGRHRDDGVVLRLMRWCDMRRSHGRSRHHDPAGRYRAGRLVRELSHHHLVAGGLGGVAAMSMSHRRVVRRVAGPLLKVRRRGTSTTARGHSHGYLGHL